MPSDKHEQLKVRALKWLNARVTGKGMRAASEVYLREKYQADVVAICRLQRRYMDDLLPEWREDKVGNEPTPEPPLGPFSFVFECKQSVKDYLSTFGSGGEDTIDCAHMHARRDPVANFHFVVVTEGVDEALHESDRARGWGWLVEKGGGLGMEEKPAWAGHGYVDWQTAAWRVLWGMDSSAMESLLRMENE